MSTDIVVVDQTPSGQRLAEGLRGAGRRVAKLEGLAECLALIRREPPRLVLSELRLSDASGFELLKEARALYPDLVVIIVSGFLSIASAQRVMQLGAADCLCKPCTVDQVLAAAKEGESAGPPWMALENASRQYIQDTLTLCGSIAKTARVLGVDRRSLRRRLIRYRAPE
jgi:two-component system response regulator RegA